MCGVTGFFLTRAGISDAVLRETASQMAAAIHHRGPDASGAWSDEQYGIALGHARLAVVDLSSAGHQPMVSACGRYVICFNGEIYNHLALRAELDLENSRTRQHQSGKQFEWRGHSDTETLLAAFMHWGVEATLKKTVGMFAIAMWDQLERTLYLARDRLGEKPLYYGWVGQGAQRALVFGSELKALRAYPDFAAPISREALAQYLRFMYVPAPHSIYQGIFKLEPGCLLTVRGQPPDAPPAQPLQPGETYGSMSLQRWWSLAHAVEAGVSNRLTDETEAVRQLEATLAEAVRLQSQADVPLGAFLSGGVDSSTIVALMQRQALAQGSTPVQTFTVGFDEARFDESHHARAVARCLGTQHHEMHVSAHMAQEVIPKLPWMYDEPFADSSQISTYLVCQAARQHVTVALSGDAGDELFGGYNRYLWGPRIWNRVAWLPYPLRRRLCRAIQAIPMAGWDALSGLAGVAQLGDKAHKLAARLDTVKNIDELYFSLVTEWQDPAKVVIGALPVGVELEAVMAGKAIREDGSSGSRRSALNDELPSGLDPVERMMFRDTLSYLPDDILCKVDRAAMGCSLETRVPFLDHRVVELAWRLPLDLKLRGNVGKWALRQILYKYVPRELIDRPKAGFAIPIGQWLRGPLRDWAEDLLSESRLRQEGYLDPGPIREIWQQHLTGRWNWAPRLWSVLMFQAWLEKNS